MQDQAYHYRVGRDFIYPLCNIFNLFLNILFHFEEYNATPDKKEGTLCSPPNSYKLLSPF